MNRAIANILKNRINGLPFLDKLSGLVQTVERQVSNDDGVKKVDRFPMTYDIDASDAACNGRIKDMIPDSSKKSIVYFEDFGSLPGSKDARGMLPVESRIRLICWLNRKRLVEDIYQDLASPCIAMLIERLVNINPISIGMFTRMMIQVAGIAEQSPALFSRYTYDEKVRQFLMPPYDAFAIDLKVSYLVNKRCADQITWINYQECTTE